MTKSIGFGFLFFTARLALVPKTISVWCIKYRRKSQKSMALSSTFAENSLFISCLVMVNHWCRIGPFNELLLPKSYCSPKNGVAAGPEWWSPSWSWSSMIWTLTDLFLSLILFKPDSGYLQLSPLFVGGFGAQSDRFRAPKSWLDYSLRIRTQTCSKRSHMLYFGLSSCSS